MIVELQVSDKPLESLGHQLSEATGAITRIGYYQFSKSTSWHPAVNVYEGKTHFYVCAELAGMKKENIRVDVQQTRVIIRGERSLPLPPSGKEPRCVLRLEIDSGTFERTVEMPATADMNHIEAEYDGGFLWVTIGKQTG